MATNASEMMTRTAMYNLINDMASYIIFSLWLPLHHVQYPNVMVYFANIPAGRHGLGQGTGQQRT